MMEGPCWISSAVKQNPGLNSRAQVKAYSFVLEHQYNVLDYPTGVHIDVFFFFLLRNSHHVFFFFFKRHLAKSTTAWVVQF